VKPNVALVFFIVITIAVCVAVTHLLAVPVQVKTDPGSASNGAVAEINIVFQQFRGVAPVTIYDLAAGDHIVNLKLTGYSDWSSSVTVSLGQAAQVSAVFAPGGPIQSPTYAGTPAILACLAFVAIAVLFRFRK